ncbi:MAG: Gfo/Idh/MocA family oxidoreductase [Tannerella sp.]|jgi:hypothetical protein|nr:Gfo/Idh/MocA family oxidoreductase [Tannerella sp.]
MEKKLLILVLLLIVYNVSGTNKTKLGIIGLDTSHSVAFIKAINDNEKNEKAYADFRVVAAYPYGSKIIESSSKRIPEYIETAEKSGVEIVNSIEDLLKRVDYVLLETNDGTLHLEQAIEVFKSGKPVFIDKPIAATLADGIAIFKLAEKYNVPLFSASSLRYNPAVAAINSGEYGKVLSADCYSPAHREATHSEFFWYGVHGAEMLFAVMGTGCLTVCCISSEDQDLAVGVWNDDRIGSFRGLTKGSAGYGGTAFCEKKIVPAAKHEGYEGLLKEILKFFTTKVPPVPAQETLEIFTFMEAASKSKKNGGKTVKLADVYKEAEKKADKIIGNKK